MSNDLIKPSHELAYIQFTSKLPSLSLHGRQRSNKIINILAILTMLQNELGIVDADLAHIRTSGLSRLSTHIASPVSISF